jgi:hypothetical protein
VSESDAPPQGQGVLPLRAALTDFYSERSYSFACPVCSFHYWYALTPNEKTSVLPLNPGTGLETYSMGCIRCGYVVQHLKGVVDGTVPIPPGLQDEG